MSNTGELEFLRKAVLMYEALTGIRITPTHQSDADRLAVLANRPICDLTKAERAELASLAQRV
jgi:hypothetical protein